MKKLLALLLVSITLIPVSCKKDTPSDNNGINSVSTDYKAFVIEFTATWCPHCGTYAYPAWHNVFANHQYKVTGISVHPDDDIVLTAYPPQADFESYYQCAGYPTSGVNINGNGYPMSNYYDSYVNPAITNNATAKAGIGLSSSISGSTMTVNTKTVFFADITGAFSLAVYLTEDGIINDQNTETTVITAGTHDHVFRGAAGNKAFGTMIINGGATKGSKVDGTYTIPIPNDVRNKNNLHVVVVLWKVDPLTGLPLGMVNSNVL